MAPFDPAAAGMTYGRAPGAPEPERLVRAHLELVRKVAWHVHGRVSSAIDIEDLVQIGMVALVECANHYEDRGHAFSTYASVRIRGAMVDHLRRQARMCRSAMAARRELAGVRGRLERVLGRAPTDPETAAELGLDAAGYHALLARTETIREESLDDLYSDESLWFADRSEAADEALDRESLKHAIAAGIAQLSQREALVLQLYFAEEMNLDEIGLTLGVGAARVCQIKKAALDRLRETLADWG